MFQSAIYYLLAEILIKVIDVVYRKIVKLHILNTKTALKISESLPMKNKLAENIFMKKAYAMSGRETYLNMNSFVLLYKSMVRSLQLCMVTIKKVIWRC